MIEVDLPTFLAVSLAILLPFLFLRRFLSSSSSSAPCPESYPLIGNLPSLLHNRHRFHDWITDMLAATPSSTLHVPSIIGLTSPGICTADPANVAHLLSSNFSNYVKGHRFRSHLGDLLGDGIFSSDGHLWLAQRKSASRVFSTRSLKLFAARVVGARAASSLLPSLSDLADNGATFDLQLVLQEFTFRNLCEVAFGVDPAGELGAGFFQVFDDAVEVAFSRMLSPAPAIWKAKRWLRVGSEKRFKEAVKEIDRFAYEVIRLKEEKLLLSLEEDKKGADQDLLTRFMALTSEHVENNNEEERRRFLRDIIVSFVLAGKDSTSTALTWFFWLVAGNRRCEELILDELSSSSSPVPGYEGLKRLDYLHAAITESMRLFRPVPINSRQVENDDVLPDGTRVTRGWFADYSAYAMGRMERLWGPDCREFRPERWLSTDEGEDGAVRFKARDDQFRYPVFHGGPRVCLGKDMAYIQMKLIAAAVMREFEVVPVDGGATPERMVSPPYVITALLKMKGGLPVRIRRRAREAGPTSVVARG